jgi:hypothetical protein
LEPLGAPGVTVRDFEEDLRVARVVVPFWRDVYDAVYQCPWTWIRNDGDNAENRAGVDCMVILADDTRYTFDEKTRYQYYKQDIALEHRHEYDDGHVAPGWVEKSLVCDAIAYGWLSRGEAYLLEWSTLRDAWNENKARWLELHFWNPRPSENKRGDQRWRTWNTMVPVRALEDAGVNLKRYVLHKIYWLDEGRTTLHSKWKKGRKHRQLDLWER